MELIDQEIESENFGLQVNRYVAAARILLIFLSCISIYSISALLILSSHDFKYNFGTIASMLCFAFLVLFHILQARKEMNKMSSTPVFNYGITGIITLVNCLILVILVAGIIDTLTRLKVDFGLIFRLTYFTCLSTVVLQDFKYIKWDFKNKRTTRNV